MFQIMVKTVKNIDAIVNERRDTRKPEVSRHARAVTISYVTVRLTLNIGGSTFNNPNLA